MFRLIRNLIAPYRRTLAIVFLAMLVETAMSLAGPWPLKIVLDNVVGSHHLPAWLDSLVKHVAGGAGKMQIAAIAALGFVAIAAIRAIASYVANYYTESVGQWVAHDLRLRAYHHLQRLSLRLLQHAPDRHYSEYASPPTSRPSRALRLPARSVCLSTFHDHRNAGPHVLAQFGFRPGGRDCHAVPAAVCFRFKKAVKKATKSPQEPERHRYSGGAGPGIGARGARRLARRHSSRGALRR